MKSNYKRLGDYIRQVSVKNANLLTTDLCGVNYQKYFMPSVANVVGTDLRGYKVVAKNQFACNLMHVGRDECLPIALHKGEHPIIVSPAYYCFEVKDESKILPDYLFLWFKRKEFDREACFYTDADVRQGLIKSSFLDMKINVPPIEEQRKIVSKYQAIEQRIENNRRLIATLEATAQTIYRKMFVEDIDPENLPEGWRMGSIGDLFQLQRGHDLPSQDRKDGPYPIYASTGITGFHNEYKVKGPCVVTGRSGSIGVVNYVHDDFWPLNTTLFIKDSHNSSMEFAYFKLKELRLGELVAGYAAVPTLNRNDVHSIVSPIPPINKINSFSNKVSSIFQAIRKFDVEMTVLDNILSLLLSKLSNY